MNLLKVLITIVILSITLPVMAKDQRENIQIVWGFNIGSSQANTVRIMVEELNQQQNKYQFQLVHRPGAGGTIGANSVTANPNNTIVAMSSSFIIRPLFEKAQTTHNLDNFTPILVQGTGAPLFVVSHKLTHIRDLINQPDVTIGVSGIGSISHLVANEFVALNSNIRIINFKNMVDATTAAAGGHVDVAIGLYPDLQGLIDAKKLTVLGYTGSREISGFENLLLLRNGVPEASGVTSNHAMFVSTAMNPERFQDIRHLLVWANQTPRTLQGYAKDQMIPADLNLIQTRRWYESQRKYWQQKINKINSKTEIK